MWRRIASLSKLRVKRNCNSVNLVVDLFVVFVAVLFMHILCFHVGKTMVLIISSQLLLKC